uniref:Uncharacterized protein n=1 Tax=Anguilla anguilla TaxID=7936 RepID=A0A0E9WZI0_ANGAN
MAGLLLSDPLDFLPLKFTPDLHFCFCSFALTECLLHASSLPHLSLQTCLSHLQSASGVFARCSLQVYNLNI